jgi:hypothetical protein
VSRANVHLLSDIQNGQLETGRDAPPATRLCERVENGRSPRDTVPSLSRRDSVDLIGSPTSSTRCPGVDGCETLQRSRPFSGRSASP